VLRHRLVLSYEALAEEVTPDDIIARVLQAIPAPEVTPHTEGRRDGDEQQWKPRSR
jgi:MoxR-like ATPase